MMEVSEVLRTALNLGIDDRALLAEELLASLEDISEEEAERLWAGEAQRRLEGYRTGHAKGVQAEAVHKQVERLFRDAR